MESSSETDQDGLVSKIRTFPRRFFVISITYAIFFITNFQNSEYTSIETTVSSYYRVSDVAVTFTGTIFPLVYLPLAYPLFLLTESSGIRHSIVLGTFLTSLGCSIKCFSANPSQFWVILVGQALCAIGQVFVYAAGPSVAAIWFDPKAVATVNAIAYGMSCLSSAVGFVVPSLVAVNGLNLKTVFNQLNIAVAAFAGVVFLFTVFGFQEKPPVPPSYTQLNKESTPQAELRTKDLLCSRNYLLLAVGYSISQLVDNIFMWCINEMMSMISSDLRVVTIVGIVLNAGSCFGAVLFGRLLDRTKRFRELYTSLYLLTVFSLIFFLFAIWHKNMPLVYLSSVMFGLTFDGFAAISLDTVIELTYPFPETRSVGALFCISAAFSTPSPLIVAKLIRSIGVVNTMFILLALLLVGFVCILCVKWDLKRQRTEDAFVEAIRDDEIHAVN